MAEAVPEEFPDFGLVMIDPVVQTSLDRMREFQTELNQSPNTPQERVNEMIEALDKDWIHINEEVVVTGLVTTPVIEPAEITNESGETRIGIVPFAKYDDVKHTVNGQTFISRGFDVVMEPFLVGGEEVGVRHILTFIFQREVTMYDKPEGDVPTLLTLRSYADPNEVSIDFHYDSPQYERMKLTEYFPEALARIEAEVLPLNRVADKLMALKDIPITAAEYITRNELQTLIRYIDGIIDSTADRVPYTAKFSAGSVFWAYNLEDITECVSFASEEAYRLVTLSGMIVTPKIDVTIADNKVSGTLMPNEYQIRLVMSQVNADFEDDTDDFTVALSDIAALQSIRQDYFYES